ncbi:hypothetical protein PTKIN_Ptkin04bG0224000 [Pterospermum kingtungense]
MVNLIKAHVDERRARKTDEPNTKKGMIDLLLEAEDEDGEKLEDECNTLTRAQPGPGSVVSPEPLIRVTTDLTNHHKSFSACVVFIRTHPGGHANISVSFQFYRMSLRAWCYNEHIANLLLTFLPAGHESTADAAMWLII